MAKKEGRILVVDDEDELRYLVVASLEAEGYSIDQARDGVEAINTLQSKSYDAAFLDVTMPKADGIEVLKFIKEISPSTEVIMVTGVKDVKTAVECMKLGAYDYTTKPFSKDELCSIANRAMERRRLLRENVLMRNELARLSDSPDIIGESPALKQTLALAARIAPAESTVLVQGPSGTGKELLANFIRRNSSRSNGPFIVLNCASIPDTLIESELFGHEKGAFTDAKEAKQGLVELAEGGTLFLDEVGDVSHMVQPKLLRFIQTGEYRRVGGTKVLTADVRIVSATNKNLAEEVHAGRFREDLLYRLNVITIEIPPLRERKEDIPLLVNFFLKSKLKTKTRATVEAKAVDILMKYDWPGNIRELENVIERAAILSRDGVIRPEDLSLPLKSGFHEGVTPGNDALGTPVPMKEIERMHIEGVLKGAGGNKPRASEILGISLKTLYTKLGKFQSGRSS